MLVKELVNTCVMMGNGKVKIVNQYNMDDKFIGEWADIKNTPVANFEVTKWLVRQRREDFFLVMEVA